MARTIGKSNGQALVELMAFVTAVLFVVCAAMAVFATLKKTMKHDFISVPTLPVATENVGQLLETTLKDKTRFFSKQKTDEALESLRSEGWSEDRRLKVPEGLVILLSNGDRHMDFIKSKGEILGVYR